MSKPNNQKVLSSDAKRGRPRAPLASVLAVLSIIIACAVFLGVRYLWNKNSEDEVSEPEQTIDNQVVEKPTETPNNQPPISADVTPHPKTPAIKVKGVFIDAWTVAMEDKMTSFIDLCETSEINAIVIDVKDDSGSITFTSDNEQISAACANTIPNIERLLSRLKEHGIYTIARLVCFKDPLWSEINPGLAIHNSRGAKWVDANGVSWLDPYNTGTWEYISAVAKEAAQIGFDEIQLDYVRFPADGNLDEIDYERTEAGDTKSEVICDFLDYIREELADTSVWLSADVFGIIAVAGGDFEGIGQDLDSMLQNADYICPMIYPSHFANKNANGAGQIINDILFEIPDLEPYEVVYNLLRMVKDRLPEDGNHAIIRPYLQAFTASYLGNGYYMEYTAQEVLKQIRAVYDAGFDEWILWNHSGDYSIYENVSSVMSSENSAGSSSETPAINNA